MATEKSTFPESRLPTLSSRIGRQRSGLPRPSLLPVCVRPESQLTITEKADTEKSEKVETPMTSHSATKHSEEHSEWKSWIGHRVCIGTVKQGILRYFGETHFAEGIWCGVELSEPIGKNDGSVKGVRYFYCQDNHGIFAPLSKIEKSLSSELSNESSDIRQLSSKTQNSEIKSKLPPPKILFKSIAKDNKNCYSENDDIPVGDATFSKFPKVGMNETVITYKKRTNDISFNIPSKITRLSSFHPQVLDSKECDSKSKNFFISTTTNVNCFTNKITLARKRSLPINVSYSIRTPGQYLDQGTEGSKNAKELLNRTVSLSEASYSDDVFAKESEPCNLNSTFSTTHEICGGDVLNSTFSLLPSSGDVVSDANEKDDHSLEHNRTFTVDEIQQAVRTFENATPNLLNKHKGSEEDLVSIECDESLGILTPSQMKDFTVCTDYQAPLLDAANLIRIPKMESCDDINDIPEDEIIQNISPGFSPIEDIREVQSIFPGNGMHFESTGTESSASPSPEINLRDFLPESFDCSQKKDDTAENNYSCGSVKTSTPFSNSQNLTVKNTYLFTEELLDQNKNSGHSRKFFSGHDCSFQEHCCPTNSSHNLLEVKKILREKSFTKSTDDISRYDEVNSDNGSLLHHDLINVTVSVSHNKMDKCEKSEANIGNSNMDKNVAIINEIKLDVPFENLQKKHDISVDNVYEDFCAIKLCSSADEKSVGTNSFPSHFQEKTTEISELNLGHIFPKKEHPHPASTYTVGSTDTGYQGDGEFDNQSEPGIATVESPCDENMKQSMHDSCIGTDYSHSERNQKSDIMTDSDFYTDSGGVGMTESEIELDGECKDLNRTFDKPFSTLGDNDNHADYLNDVEKNTMNITEESSYIDVENKTMTSDINTGSNIAENALSSTFEVKSDLPDETHIHQKINDTFTAENSVVCLQGEEKLSVAEHFTNLGENNTLNFSENKFQEKDSSLSVQKLQPAKKNLPLNVSEAANVSVRQSLDNNRNSMARTPKKNVSKFKSTVETSKLLNKVVDKSDIKSTRKNSKWDAVTSKIAASLADEKTKPKIKKEIKSRIDTNLTATRYSIVKRSPKPNSDSTSILTENENNSNRIENGSKLVKNVLNSQRFQEGKENVQQFTFVEPEVYAQNTLNQTLGHGDGHSKPDKLPITQKNQRKKRFESYPHSYPLSPGAKSDSSTVSLASYGSKTSWHSSKIAVLKSRKASVGSIGTLSRHHDSLKPTKLFAAKTVPLRVAPRKSFTTKAANLKNDTLP